MNSIIATPAWVEALGWTLIHSLWQGIVIFLALYLALRLIPVERARLRYAVACVAMAGMLLLGVGTFLFINDPPVSTQGSTLQLTLGAGQEAPGHSAPGSVQFEWFREWVDQNISLIVLCWLAGAVVFSLRIVSGWWYISRLRAEARLLDARWSERLQRLADQLGLDRPVALAESVRVHGPVVIGFLKPMVLIPVGMLSGLSPEQVETIFIHELAHIRRHDYLINFLQTIVETVFFFNPFVWIVSNAIRREREYCCDDIVVRNHERSMAYASALARLEERRLMRSTFAVALAGHKNHLLDRIKRIMERSAKNYSLRERLVPAALLAVGLVCASWLTMGRSSASRDFQQEEKVQTDTTGKKKTRSAVYSRESITTYDENGNPHEEVTEKFEGDEELKPLLTDPHPPGMSMSPFAMPDYPAIPVIPAIPDVPPIPAIPGFPDLGAWMQMAPFNADTLPEKGHGSNQEWEQFSKEFESRFREEFQDFFKDNEKGFDKLMEEMEHRFSDDFEKHGLPGFPRFDDESLGHLRSQLEELAQLDVMEAQRHALEVQEQMKHLQEDRLEAHREALREMEESMLHRQSDMRKAEAAMRDLEEKMKAFETELKQELVKDGYLKEDEEITDINWNDDGDIEINGEKIKEKDREKYERIHDRYLNDRDHFRYIE